MHDRRGKPGKADQQRAAEAAPADPARAVPSPASPGARKAPARDRGKEDADEKPDGEPAGGHILRSDSARVEREDIGDDRLPQAIEHRALVHQRSARLRN